MGLTVNYKIRAGSLEMALEGLKKIEKACKDLPFKEVGKVEYKAITPADMDYWHKLQNDCCWPNNTPDNLRKRDELLAEKGFDIHEMIAVDVHNGGRPTSIVSLFLWPGEGCEDCTIQFLRQYDNTFLATGCCKTHYAEHFVRCHTLVCSMLDLAKDVGFEIDVNDEGEWYETRDLKVLAKNLGDYNAIVGSIGGMLKKAGWDEGQVVCALDKSKTILKVS